MSIQHALFRNQRLLAPTQAQRRISHRLTPTRAGITSTCASAISDSSSCRFTPGMVLCKTVAINRRSLVSTSGALESSPAIASLTPTPRGYYVRALHMELTAYSARLFFGSRIFTARNATASASAICSTGSTSLRYANVIHLCEDLLLMKLKGSRSKALLFWKVLVQCSDGHPSLRCHTRCCQSFSLPSLLPDKKLEQGLCSRLNNTRWQNAPGPASFSALNGLMSVAPNASQPEAFFI